jgi:EF-hand domain pair
MSVAPESVLEDITANGGDDNALWLNLSLFPSLWRLFRKSTSVVIAETLQPVLDTVDLPDFISALNITGLKLGSRPPLVRKISRLACRARSELQYSFNCRLFDDELRIDIDCFVRIPFLKGNRTFRVPVTVSKLDVDAKVWTGFQMTPSQPWVRYLQWALLKLPIIKMEIKVGGFLPVTAVPVLSQILLRMLTVDVPREFLFPKTQVVDLHSSAGGDTGLSSSSTIRDAISEAGRHARGQEINVATEDDILELRRQYPALWALFDSIDDDDDGALTPREVCQGLTEDWGFSSSSPTDYDAMFTLLDQNGDGMVTFDECVLQVPLSSSFLNVVDSCVIC